MPQLYESTRAGLKNDLSISLTLPSDQGRSSERCDVRERNGVRYVLRGRVGPARRVQPSFTFPTTNQSKKTWHVVSSAAQAEQTSTESVWGVVSVDPLSSYPPALVSAGKQGRASKSVPNVDPLLPI